MSDSFQFQGSNFRTQLNSIFPVLTQPSNQTSTLLTVRQSEPDKCPPAPRKVGSMAQAKMVPASYVLQAVK